MIPSFKTLDWSFTPLISQHHPDAADIPCGLEGGYAFHENGLYHLLPTERTGTRGSDKTRLGYWTSPDGQEWTRVRTLLEGTGDETGTDDDAVLWQATPIFDPDTDRWLLFYVAYAYERYPSVGYHHRRGRILCRHSLTPGREGIGGPYSESAETIMTPEDGKQPWEGDQGVDSFFPYRVGDRWYALYGSARTESLPARACTFWGVGVATADHLLGPWVRLPEGNPVDLRFGSDNQYHCMPENPLVYPLPEGGLIAFHDYVHGNWDRKEDGFKAVNPEIPEDNHIPYMLSQDGVQWTFGGMIEFPHIENRWWTEMRTPLSFIPEGDGVYRILFTALKDYAEFAPMGCVRVQRMP